MRKVRLFTPGPTPLIPEAQLALARPLVHHRTADFQALLLETRCNLQRIFKTENEIVILTASGTGAMEAAVANLHSPGDQVLVVVAGKFGERWAAMTEAYGLECIQLVKEYGDAASPEEILEVLRNNPLTKSVFIQGSETSTATSHDMKAIGETLKDNFPDVLLIVDGITAVGSQELQPDDWGLDVVISSSQKAFGVPPGLSFLSLSPRVVRLLDERQDKTPYYLNLKRELDGQRSGSTAFTPAILLVAALKEATVQFLAQGVDRIIQDTAVMARATRKGLEALGFRLLSSSPSNAATAAFPPAGISADRLRGLLEEKFGIKVAGGQGSLKGQIIRIAHLGYFDILDVVSILSAIEICVELEVAGRGLVGTGIRAAVDEARRNEAF